MKRIGFKVGAIASGYMALALFAAWVATLPTDATSAQLVFERPQSRVEMAAGEGRVILCDSFANREVMEAVDQSRLISPGVAKDQGLSFPGFSFRRITLTSGRPTWSVSFSLLIPCVLMAGSAGFLWWRFRTSKRTASVAQAAKDATQTERRRDGSDAPDLDRAA
jgi:hypothetical protein